jgi:diguanylate cyclase (GGDEF)-like protein/PAS domain S-box-containing protein
MDFKYEDLLENIYDGLYVVDRRRRIMYWNKAAERITGYTADDMVGSHCFDSKLIHVDDNGANLCRGMCPLAATIKDGAPREAEVYLHHKDGHRVPVSVRVTPQHDRNGNIIGGIELFSDLSNGEAMRLRIAELEKLAFLDGLTLLANKRYIDLELERHISEMGRYGRSFGILLMDIDHFKIFNDTHGHMVGDRVLKTVAQSLLHNARPFDVYGRWGGEEFIGIIRHVDMGTLTKIGARVRALVEQTHVQVAEALLHVTISMGATIAAADDTVQSLVKRVDGLMYRSKEQGRNCLTAG